MTVKKLYLTYSKSNNPYENLAIENSILNDLTEGEIHLLFWVNEPCIVMGRFQNPFLECDLRSALEDGVKLVRRQSGGGCVYHDRGNLNFSFICDKSLHDHKKNHEIILMALKNLGISAETNKRIDLVYKDGESFKKFSGSAFKEKRKTAFHHGTLLINSELEKLNFYLRHRDGSVKSSKSIKSVRSKVINLKELNSDLDVDLIIEGIKKTFGEYYSLDVEMSRPSSDSNYQKEISNTKWVMGETPKFSLSLNGEFGDVELELRKLKVEKVELHSGDLHPSFINEFEEELLGKSIDYILSFEFQEFEKLYSVYGQFFGEFRRWITKELCLDISELYK